VETIPVENGTSIDSFSCGPHKERMIRERTRRQLHNNGKKALDSQQEKRGFFVQNVQAAYALVFIPCFPL
jgi:hypothetical protein